MLAADGELTRRHDAYRAAAAAPADNLGQRSLHPRAPGPTALARVTLHWSDGTESVIWPPLASGPAV